MKFIGIFSLVFLFLTTTHAGNWGKKRLWKDGRAEVAFYDSERVVYGKERKFREQIVIVAEDFRKDTMVKADKPKDHDTVRVLKMNVAQKFETENYPYSYLGSVFVSAKNPQTVLKMTVGSQEWCGNTFKLYKRDAEANKGQLTWHSYFDGEADQAVAIELMENDYFYDQLPISLRDLPFEKGYEMKARVWDPLLSNRGVAPVPQAATIRVEGEELIRCRAGSLKSWKVIVKTPKGTDTYWFEKKYPHLMTKMVGHDGTKRHLFTRARWSYWDRRIPMPNILK